MHLGHGLDSFRLRVVERCASFVSIQPAQGHSTCLSAPATVNPDMHPHQTHPAWARTGKQIETQSPPCMVTCGLCCATGTAGGGRELPGQGRRGRQEGHRRAARAGAVEGRRQRGTGRVGRRPPRERRRAGAEGARVSPRPSRLCRHAYVSTQSTHLCNIEKASRKEHIT